MTEDRHTCLAGAKCRAATVEEGRKVGAKTEKPDSLCDGCTRRVRNAVEDLPFDYVALHAALGEQGTNAGSRVKATPKPPLPIDKHKYALMTEVTENLQRAAEIVSEALNCDPPDGRENPLWDIKTSPGLAQGHAVQRCADMVSPNVDKLIAAGETEMWVWERCDERCGRNGCDAGEHLRLSQRTGVQFALTLQNLHSRARSVLGEYEKVLRLPTPCGNCAAPYIFQNPATGSVFCRDCNTEWTEELLGLAGRIMKQREEEEVAINEEMKARAELAEWLHAELEWKFSLALECTSMSAAEFAKEVLAIKPKTTA